MSDGITARELAHGYLGACVEEHTKSCDMLTIEFGELFKEVAGLNARVAALTAALEAATGALELIRSEQEDGSPAAATRSEAVAVNALARVAALTTAHTPVTQGEPT